MRDGQNVEVGQTGGRKKEERGKEGKEDESGAEGGGGGGGGGGGHTPPHGLAIGDLLEAIDGTDVSSWAISQIGPALRGAIGSFVTVRVRAPYLHHYDEREQHARGEEGGAGINAVRRRIQESRLQGLGWLVFTPRSTSAVVLK